MKYAITDPIMDVIFELGLPGMWEWHAFDLRHKLHLPLQNKPGPSTQGTPARPQRSMTTNIPNTPGMTTKENSSEGSRADYNTYTIRSDPEDKLVAVLMEAKMTSHNTFCHMLWVRCALAHWVGKELVFSPSQLLGYYVRFRSEQGKEPLCLLVSEESVQLLCFPYKVPSGATDLVDSIALPELPLFITSKHTASPSPEHSQLYL